MDRLTYVCPSPATPGPISYRHGHHHPLCRGHIVSHSIHKHENIGYRATHVFHMLYVIHLLAYADLGVTEDL